MCGADVALGPGRADLLEQIAQTGSLRAAAARLGMSYMRAWGLAKDVNRWFRSPLLQPTRGGRTGGGAVLTPAGRKALALYRTMEKRCLAATSAPWEDLRRLLKR